MSALFKATSAHSNAAAHACVHALRGDCPTCPRSLAGFLIDNPEPQNYCTAGWRLIEEIHAAELAITEAIAHPDRQEVVQ